MTTKNYDRHMSLVFLAQARHFRRHAAFHATLLSWAAARRLKASKGKKQLRLPL